MILKFLIKESIYHFLGLWYKEYCKECWKTFYKEDK
jgi:hypothetical protein